MEQKFFVKLLSYSDEKNTASRKVRTLLVKAWDGKKYTAAPPLGWVWGRWLGSAPLPSMRLCDTD